MHIYSQKILIVKKTGGGTLLVGPCRWDPPDGTHPIGPNYSWDPMGGTQESGPIRRDPAHGTQPLGIHLFGTWDPGPETQGNVQPGFCEPWLGPRSWVPEKELALPSSFSGTRDPKPSVPGPGSQVPEKELAPLGTWDLRPRVPEKELAPLSLPYNK